MQQIIASMAMDQSVINFYFYVKLQMGEEYSIADC